MLGHIFCCHELGVLLVCSGQRPGVLLSSLQCAGCPTADHLALVLVLPRLRIPVRGRLVPGALIATSANLGAMGRDGQPEG